MQHANKDIKTSVHLAELIFRHFEGTISAEEQQELDIWLQADQQNQHLFAELSKEEKREKWLEKWQSYDLEEGRTAIHARIKSGKKKFRLNRWIPYAAAAAILIAVAAGYLWKNAVTPPAEVTVASSHDQDVPPGGNKAVLTLANGKKITLDSNANGLLAQQGNMQVINLNAGQLAYKSGSGNESADEKVPYNTLATPNGGQYRLMLPDGTKVWLNAASSLQYPTAFTGNDRTVTLTGEAYFEVKHNSAHPFIVKVNGNEIEDLGTAFNIKAYTGEGALQATLIEGKIKVSSGDASRMLVPGEQAITEAQGKIKVQKVNAADAAAWKDGYFVFNNSDIKSVMQTLARWYDVRVKYGKDIPNNHFDGMIQRNLSLATVLKYLAKNGIDFQIENRIVTISKANK